MRVATLIPFTTIDTAGPSFKVMLGETRVGLLRRAVHGPGYFLKIDGVMWQNTPGARMNVDAGFFAETYCKSKPEAMRRIRHALEGTKP